MAMLLWKGGKRLLLFMAFSWKVNLQEKLCLLAASTGTQGHSGGGSLLIKLTRKCVLAMNR